MKKFSLLFVVAFSLLTACSSHEMHESGDGTCNAKGCSSDENHCGCASHCSCDCN